MLTRSVGLVLFVTLVVAAFCLGQIAKRRFPRTYTAIDKTLSAIELVLIVVVFFGFFYFTR